MQGYFFIWELRAVSDWFRMSEKENGTKGNLNENIITSTRLFVIWISWMKVACPCILIKDDK